MELTQLRQFQEIAKCKTLTQAAEHLHISQPALSTMLKKLEAELGLALFDRTKNRITLNEAGALTLQHAERILQEVDHLKTSLTEYSQRDKLFKVEDRIRPLVNWLKVCADDFAKNK
jgi:DNA-binding transcriptional LysR family regulator